MYHKVGTPDPQAANPALYVKTQDFRIQMEKLISWGYESLDFHDLLSIFEGGTPPRKGFIVTFDDGFMDNFTNAFPILKELNIKGTVFLVSKFLGKKSKWPESKEKKTEAILSLKEIEEMKKGGISFQAHSETHRHLSRLSEEEITDEVLESGKFISKVTGEEQVCFCYPYGSFNNTVVEAVKKAGYKMACSIKRENRYNLADRFVLPRLPIHVDTTPQRLRYRLSYLYHMEHSWKK